MKSGEVLTDKRWKWYEPEHWRFGDPAGRDGKINYLRHASGVCIGITTEGEGQGRWSEQWVQWDVAGWTIMPFSVFSGSLITGAVPQAADCPPACLSCPPPLPCRPDLRHGAPCGPLHCP